MIGDRHSTAGGRRETAPLAGGNLEIGRAARRFGPEHAAVAALFLLAFALYWPVRGHQFVNIDDSFYVYKNAVVLRGLTGEGLRWAFTQMNTGNWHPVTWLSHMLDAQLFGSAAAGHHLTSAFIHAVSAALLFLALWRMTAALGRSALVSAVFALHPLRVESVAWVAERKDVLGGLFWMLTILAYLRWARQPRTGRYLAVAAAFTLGLLSKPMLVTLPFVLLLLDVWPLGRASLPLRRNSGAGNPAPHPAGAAGLPRLLLEKAPLLALSAASSVVTVIAQQRGGAIGSTEKYTVLIRAANALLSYFEYLLKILWPRGLMAFYPHPGSGFSPGEVAVAGLALLLLTLLSILAFRSRPWLAAGWLWYLGTLVPVIGLIQVGKQGMADRYTYLPGIGIAIALAWGLSGPARSPRRGRWVLGAVAALPAVLAAMTLKQTATWRDNETLYRQVLAVDPDSHMALSVLGTLLTQQGRVEEGTELLDRAYRSSPALLAGVHLQAGDQLALEGKREAALAHYRRTLRIDPGNRPALKAVARLQGGSPGEGSPAPPHAAAENADEEAASWFRSGNAFAGEGDCERAIDCYRRAVELKPDFAHAWNNLGSCYGKLDRHREAAEAFERSVAADPDNELARKNLEQARRALRR
jgi:tetratricopeptide (TPR) repeat protein